jgi:hypothetical protein
MHDPQKVDLLRDLRQRCRPRLVQDVPSVDENAEMPLEVVPGVTDGFILEAGIRP